MHRRERRYHFTDEGIASDTVIALIFSVSALILIVGLIVLAIIHGKTGEKTPMLLMAAVIMVFTAIVFSVLSLRGQSGGLKSKRAAMWITGIDTALIILLILI